MCNEAHSVVEQAVGQRLRLAAGGPLLKTSIQTLFAKVSGRAVAGS